MCKKIQGDNVENFQNGIGIVKGNIYYFSNPSIPIELKKPIIISVHKNIINRFDIVNLTISSLICSPFLAIYFIYFLKIQFSIYTFFYISVFFFLVLTIFFISLIFVLRFILKQKLTISNTSISVRDKSIEYKNIRDFMRLKDLFGYSIYIYVKDDIYPSIDFNTESIHIANTIEKLIETKISNYQGSNQ